MAFCFVSYSRRDRNRVKEIMSKAQQYGIEFWFDERDIIAGNEWEREISKGIKEACALVFFVSDASIHSEWCQKERFLAEHEQLPIIPVMIEDVSLPDALSKIQYIDLVDKLNDKVFIPALIEAIKRILDNKIDENVRDHKSEGDKYYTKINNSTGPIHIGRKSGED